MSFTAVAVSYANDVVSGNIPASEYTILACKRFLKDLDNNASDWNFKYEEELAHRACDFIQMMPHVKGKWVGKPIILEPWQIFVICNIFGWINKDTGHRRFKHVYLEVPRKNAKSTLCAAVALYMLCADGEEGAEVFSAATTRDQARAVFSVAKSMVGKSPGLRNALGVRALANSVVVDRSGSSFVPLSSDAKTLDGLNVHCAVIDELHAHKTREVYDVMETAMGSRTQPLLFCITTAGFDQSGICYEVRAFIIKVLQGSAGSASPVADSDGYFGCIWCADEDDDWSSEETWRKANPNFEVSVFPETIRQLCAKALEMASAQNNFKTKHLNIWVNAAVAWMDMKRWRECGNEIASSPLIEADDIPEYWRDKPCWIGVDLASKVDIAALSLLFRDGEDYLLYNKYYLPESTAGMDGTQNPANSSYAGWVNEGWITATLGNVIDFSTIEDDIIGLTDALDVIEVAYDPWQATQLAQRLEDLGIQTIEVRATVANFSPAMKELEALVYGDKLTHIVFLY